MADNRQRRPGTGDDRDRRRSATAGRGIPSVIRKDDTPPPTRLPPLPPRPLAVVSRTPTPENLKAAIEEVRADLARQREHSNTLTSAVERMWGVRDVGKRFDRLEHMLDKSNERTDKFAEIVIENHSFLNNTVWPYAQDVRKSHEELVSKLSSIDSIADGVQTLVRRSDDHAKRIVDLEKEHALTEQWRESHDAQDKETERIARTTHEALQRREAHDAAMSKQRALVARSPWRKALAGAIKVLAVAIAGFITAAAGYLFAQ